ncbi:YggT family protein [Amorphus coralli]|uniref:YggT family protein n=1 Tax=Amorphus coralli TaxID=340680 RepID=UPI0003629E79|nr:YggT family protein [Amorphus coralli]
MLSLIQVLLLAIKIYTWIIIAAAIFSWLYAFNVVNPRNQFIGMVGNALYKMTEPVLRPIRNILPDLGGIDISPIVLLLLLFFLQQLIINNLAPLVI